MVGAIQLIEKGQSVVHLDRCREHPSHHESTLVQREFRDAYFKLTPARRYLQTIPLAGHE